MRLFFALELPPSLRAALAAAQETLRAAGPARVTWCTDAQLHLTLAFLGDVDDPAPWVEAARGVAAAHAGLTLAPGPFGTFGQPPRVVWAGLAGPGVDALRRLVVDLERALAPLGHAPEARGFAAHVTLGRVRDGGGGRGRRPRKQHGLDELVAAVRALPAPAHPPFAVGELVLFESRLAPPRPAEYVPLARLPLAGAPAAGAPAG